MLSVIQLNVVLLTVIMKIVIPVSDIWGNVVAPRKVLFAVMQILTRPSFFLSNVIPVLRR